ncbi:MAG: hypothetical protein KC731_23645, partial [Myxococcales bacterium]|nr:hypothetical protein [Myxococcales bacterium]
SGEITTRARRRRPRRRLPSVGLARGLLAALAVSAAMAAFVPEAVAPSLEPALAGLAPSQAPLAQAPHDPSAEACGEPTCASDEPICAAETATSSSRCAP